jgi:hypothetical protein
LRNKYTGSHQSLRKWEEILVRTAPSLQRPAVLPAVPALPLELPVPKNSYDCNARVASCNGHDGRQAGVEEPHAGRDEEVYSHWPSHRSQRGRRASTRAREMRGKTTRRSRQQAAAAAAATAEGGQDYGERRCPKHAEERCMVDAIKYVTYHDHEPTRPAERARQDSYSNIGRWYAWPTS